VVRTNPITGWKSIFAAGKLSGPLVHVEHLVTVLIGSFPLEINGLNRKESANMLQQFHDHITYGHDLQVRFKWNDPNDIGKLQ
jgi:alpha-ketoglutarate-dependent taurine dioxygenase